MRIGIAGATGRMGRLLIEEARAAGHDVVGGCAQEGETSSEVTLMPVEALAEAAEAVIDFTHASAAMRHAAAMAAAGAAWILGTTGLSDEDERAVAVAAQRVAVVYAANFGPGVNVLLALARQLGAALPAEQYDAEILEMHHRQKVDAPSGTALALGRAVAEGRGVALAAVRRSCRDGHTGARPVGEIGFAALRGGQVVGEHTVLFAAAGEQIALTHRAIDRRSFATGAVRAAGWLQGRAPGLYGMADVLGLPA